MRNCKKIARMNIKETEVEMRKLETDNATMSKRYTHLKKHLTALTSKPFGILEALRYIREVKTISQAAFVRHARTHGLTRDGARTLFKQVALAQTV